MKIYLTEQQNKFKNHLDFLKTKNVMSDEKYRLTEKITSIEINTAKTIGELNLDLLYNYQIFPNNIMSFKCQWTDENRKMRVGDTIAQQVYIPPVKTFSQKIIFGVRVNEIIDQADKKGFSYQTLEGHVEKGISTFTVEQIDKELIFKVHTHSTRGNTLAKLLAPFFSIPYQSFCTSSALKNVKQQLENQ